MGINRKTRIEIVYCPGCRWLARAAWYAQELLTTYSDDLKEVALIPSSDSGVFEIRLGDLLIMDRASDGFLEAKLVKRLVRDQLAPGRALGHIDT
ncbi:MAG: SelT/selW/selH domain protein [Myxococcales bacterium]|nr:SelT/selW/selH domain protein [Myxococcales bacterium]